MMAPRPSQMLMAHLVDGLDAAEIPRRDVVPVVAAAFGPMFALIDVAHADLDDLHAVGPGIGGEAFRYRYYQDAQFHYLVDVVIDLRRRLARYEAKEVVPYPHDCSNCGGLNTVPPGGRCSTCGMTLEEANE